MIRGFLLVLFCIAAPYLSFASPKDSLVSVLARTTDPQTRLSVCRNLVDISFGEPDETSFLRKLYNAAVQVDAKEQMLDALGGMAEDYLPDKKFDSARYYLDVIEKLEPREHKDRWASLLRMALFNHELDIADEAVNKILQSYEDKDENSETIYKQIEDAYVLGASFYYIKNNDTEALPYAKRAVELAEKLPLKEGYQYKLVTMRLLASVYARGQEGLKSVSVLENLISITERYVDQYCKDRPFYPLNKFYIRTYTSLMTNIKILSKEQAESYIKRILELCETAPYMSSDRYRCYQSMSNYYIGWGNYKDARPYQDSLIKYAHEIAQYTLEGLYNVSSYLYEWTGKPAEALADLRMAIHIKDSISAADAQGQLNELQVKYDVSRLNYENIQLEGRNRQIMLISLVVVLVIVIIVCIYLYRNLKKEKMMQKRMQELKLRAEESEKMKSAFTHSMCHEIRTPLNAIVGFSDLLLDPDIEEELRLQFPELIRRNTGLLMSLINSILEVSNLDVSDEKLPCEETDVSAILLQEMDGMPLRVVKGVECKADIPDSPLYINTNARYFALVFENLLSNAAKFTNSGTITLACRKHNDRFVVTVTDTGCGIPKEMHETVFDRFIKIDDYKQGSGLGLYLCRLIVRRLHGSIFIDPDYTSGTRMIVEFPIN